MGELGMEKGTARKVIVNSAVFSIVPSLPIVITLAALMLVFGPYIPLFRMAVVGSAMYETMVANLAITSFGYEGLGDTSITASVFISVLYIISITGMVWPLCNLIALRFYDKSLKTLQKSSGFIKPAAGAMFIGLMAIMAVPRFVNYKTEGGRMGIMVCVVSGAAVLLIEFIAKKTKIKILSDFAFPLAMVLGMVAAVIVGNA
jgi:hypothetical protein